MKDQKDLEKAAEQLMNEVVDGFVFQPEEYYPKEIIGSYSGDLKDRTKVKIIIISSNE